MKSDFLLAITQLSAEKNLPKDVVLTAVEAALVSAYKKDNFASNQNIAVKINPNSGKVEVWAEKNVVEVASDKRYEINLDEAQTLKEDAQIGDAIMVEATPANAGRIAAQTAKQVSCSASMKRNTAPYSRNMPIEGGMLSAGWYSALNSGRSTLTWAEPKPYCRHRSRCAPSATGWVSASRLSSWRWHAPIRDQG